MNTSLDLVLDFWSWFENHQSHILEAITQDNDEWLRENLTVRVRSLQKRKVCPRLNWEIGPGRKKRWSFVVSPVVRDNVGLTRFAIENAPEFPDWEFHYAKPAKTGNPFAIDLADERGNRVTIDASEWSYLINPCGLRAGARGVLFVGDGVTYLSQNERKRIAYLVLDNVLGEEKVFELIGEAMLLDKSVVPRDAPTQPMGQLKGEFLRV